MQGHQFLKSTAKAVFCVAVCAMFLPEERRLYAQDFTMNPGERVAWVHGRVITASGEAVRDAHVEVRTLMGHTIASAMVDSTGGFHIPNLAPGSYELVANSGTARSVTDIQVSAFPQPLTIQLGSAAEATESHGSISVSTLTVPAKAQKAFETADRLFIKNDLTGAWTQVNKALEVCPKYAAALTLRGLLRMGNNQVQHAVDDFTAAIGIDRGYVLAHIGLAATYNATTRFDDALRAIEQANSISPRSWQAHFEASKALLGKKNFDRALQEASLSASLLGRDFPIINVVKAHAYLGLQDKNSAARELRQYLKQQNAGPLADEIRALLAQLGG